MRRLVALTIFLSAFLLFLAQPLIGKQVLPWFGGSAGVWSACLAFFQLVLLAGYAYAHALSRLPLRGQMPIHGVALVLAAASLPIAADAAFKPLGDEEPTARLLLLLAATIGPTYFVLSTTGPLVQSWFAAATPVDDPRRPRVYRLFSVSNLASLFALVAYPFAIEPFLTIRQQVWAWSIAFGAFVALCALSALLTVRAAARASAASTPACVGASSAAAPVPTLRHHLQWLALAAIGCALLVSVSAHITQNVASVPLLWILPLAIYLITFVLCFDSDRWYRRRAFMVLVMAIAPAMAWGLFANVALFPFWLPLSLYALGLFVGCMFCHGELARARPAAEHLTRFYLMVALGGAIGGLLVGLVAPLVFNAYWELPILLALLPLAVFMLMADREAGTRWMAAGAQLSRSASGSIALMGLFIALFTAGLGWAYRTAYVGDVVAMERSFYGAVRVTQSADGLERRLHHGLILHGQQFRDEARRARPTTYYSASSGAGVAMAALRAERGGPLRVGLIGLGVGTLATWGREGDALRFYEINPQVIALAQSHFTYLGDSRAAVSTVLGDARLVLEREAPQRYDLIVVDAFTSDAVPAHLLTREAMAIYARHLAPGGIVAFHVSNRYLDLPPVVAGVAAANGMSAVEVVDDPKGASLQRSVYVLAAADPASLALPGIEARAVPIRPLPGSRPWTDDFHNLLEAMVRSR